MRNANDQLYVYLMSYNIDIQSNLTHDKRGKYTKHVSKPMTKKQVFPRIPNNHGLTRGFIYESCKIK